MSETWLVVGLGNPGAQYAHTRHNVGQMVVAELAARRGETLRTHKTQAQVAETRLAPGAARMVLAVPTTYMNLSGKPVAALASYYQVDPARLIIVHDDLDLPFDTVRIKVGGGHGGHNGLRDIISALGTPDFIRTRVGIGRPPGRQDAADWVLEPFSGAQRDQLPVLITDAADAVELTIAQGPAAAQQRFHSPPA